MLENTVLMVYVNIADTSESLIIVLIALAKDIMIAK